MKLPATDKARLLRYKLQRLAERGIDGERATAKEKLARIETRWDFDGPAQVACGDIFAGVVYASSVAAPLTASFRDSELASFVKWALEISYGIRGGLRTNADGSVSVTVEAARESLPTLNHVAGVITRSFTELWQTFAALPGATPFDAKLFVRGLFDGLMNDEREAGSMLAQRTAKPERRTRKKRALAVAPGLSIHPYSVALDLGRKIRLSVPIDQLAGELAEREIVARLAA